VARATALVSLAFGRDEIDLTLVTNALNDAEPIVRFAGMEAAQVGRFRTTSTQLLGIANNDAIPAFRVYAIQ
jgi:hypothetical protein